MCRIVFEDLFNASEGKTIMYKDREIKLSDEISLPEVSLSLGVEFISTNSEWKQGIVIKTKGEFEINGHKLPNGIVLWEDTASGIVEIKVTSRDKKLYIYNVWDTGDGTMHYGHNGGALFVEQAGGEMIYHCNDGYPDDDFDDLVFKIKYLKQ
jgi:hypothetical protein